MMLTTDGVIALAEKMVAQGRFFRCLDAWGWRLDGGYALTTHMRFLFSGGTEERLMLLVTPCGEYQVAPPVAFRLFETAWHLAMQAPSEDEREQEVARCAARAA